MNGGTNYMPYLDGKKYSYDKKGKAEYGKALVKKLKKKRGKKTEEEKQ